MIISLRINDANDDNGTSFLDTVDAHINHAMQQIIEYQSTLNVDT